MDSEAKSLSEQVENEAVKLTMAVIMRAVEFVTRWTIRKMLIGFHHLLQRKYKIGQAYFI